MSAMTKLWNWARVAFAFGNEDEGYAYNWDTDDDWEDWETEVL